MNLPTPPANTAWTNKLAIDGSIALYSTQPAPTSLTNSISGNTLTLTWPNGQGWNLQSQTNSLSTGLGSGWIIIPGATSPFNITIDPGQPTVFFRLSFPG